MKFSKASVLSLASVVAAKTVYVTQVEYVYGSLIQSALKTAAPAAETVYVDGNGHRINSDGSPYVSVSIPTGSFGTAVTDNVAPAVSTDDSETTVETTEQPTQEPTQQPTQQPTQKPTTLVSATSSPQAPAPSASASSTGSDSTGPNEYAQLMLDIHNKFRSHHSAGPLSWDEDLALFANDYAAKFTCSMNLQHSGEHPENLAVGYGSGPDAVQAWYDEGKTYDYSSGAYNHFTQVVWKGASKLGCGIKDCRSEGYGYYINCNYDVGNIIGQFAQNVLPPN